MSVLPTLAVLAVPLFFGMLAGTARLFPDPDAAVGTLNRFVLYLAFPALIVVGMLDRDFAIPRETGFYAVVPLVALLLCAVLLGMRRLSGLRDQAGPVALTSLFANTAYVGLPVVEGLLGPEAVGLGALAVAVHVTTAMLLGPLLLLAWSGRDTGGALALAVRKVSRQPLAWAPVVGLLLRGVLSDPSPVVGLLGPLGKSASPVGLFLIGLFLQTHWRALSIGPRAWLRVGFKLAVVPLLTLGLVSVFRSMGQLYGHAGDVLLILSLMPTAISTFSIAKEFEEGVRDVAVTIVLSTALAAPLIAVAGPWIGG